MSGEVLYLRGDSNGEVEGLLAAAAKVIEHAGVPAAVIGGLAVSCRLALAHRPTADVDVVTEDPEVVAAARPAVANLIEAGIAEPVKGSATTAVRVDGTKVEIIETVPVDDRHAAEVEPDRARLFMLSHRWGLDSAHAMTLGLVGAKLQVTLPVATSAA